MTNIMMRWMRGNRGNGRAIKRVEQMHSKNGTAMVPTTPPDLSISLNRNSIIKSQLASAERSSGGSVDDDGLLHVHERVWILEEDEELKLKLLAIKLTGVLGHRGGEATADALREKFVGTGMITDAEDFVSNCLLLVLSRNGRKFRDCSPACFMPHPQMRSFTLTTCSLAMGTKGKSMCLSSRMT